jgi:hypothetical protein
VTKDVFA